MGYDSLPDLIENDRAEKQSAKDAMDNFDASLVRKRFPSIILGSSPELELYDGTTNFCETRSLLATQSHEYFLSNSMGKEQERVSVNETWHSKNSTFPSVKTYSSEDSANTLPVSEQPMPLITEKQSNQLVTSEEIIRLEPQTDAASFELFLDKSISCIPGLRKKHLNQLENCGFHTVGFA